MPPCDWTSAGAARGWIPGTGCGWTCWTDAGCVRALLDAARGSDAADASAPRAGVGVGCGWAGPADAGREARGAVRGWVTTHVARDSASPDADCGFEDSAGADRGEEDSRDAKDDFGSSVDEDCDFAYLKDGRCDSVDCEGGRGFEHLGDVSWAGGGCDWRGLAGEAGGAGGGSGVGDGAPYGEPPGWVARVPCGASCGWGGGSRGALGPWGA